MASASDTTRLTISPVERSEKKRWLCRMMLSYSSLRRSRTVDRPTFWNAYSEKNEVNARITKTSSSAVRTFRHFSDGFAFHQWSRFFVARSTPLINQPRRPSG